MLELIDHGDSVVLYGDPTLAVAVHQQLRTTQPEMACTPPRLQRRGRRQKSPFERGFIAQLLECVDGGERARLDCRREVRSINHSDAGLHFLSTGASDPENSRDTRLFDRGDDGGCAPYLVIVKVGILPPGIERTDERVVT